MGEIERRPAPLFAAVWGFLILNTLVAGVIGLEHGWYATGTLVALGLWEAVAFVHKGKLRDTLSEITTWVNRKLSKHLRPLRGWNTLVAIQAAALGRLLYVVAVYWGGPEVSTYALVIAFLFALGQHDHWLNPPEHG